MPWPLLRRSILGTLARTFGHVHAFRIGETPSTVVLAGDVPLPIEELPMRAGGSVLEPQARYAAARLRAVAVDPALPPLTDDRAPIEQMVDWELLRTLGGR